MGRHFVNCLAVAWLLACPAAASESVFVPGFFDPAHRLPKPDLSNIKLIRFLTEDDYPPFHFAAPDGALAGFDVEIARAICDELKLPCTIQPRRFETLVDALLANQGDAVIAGLARSPDSRKSLDFSVPYYRTPGRFAVAAGAALALKAAPIIPENLAGRSIGVQIHTAHEAYIRKFFPKSPLQTYDGRAALQAGLKRGDIELAFDDGIALSFWLNGADAGNCCQFIGEAFTESAYFGEGVGIALRRDEVPLRRAVDYALQKIAEKGVYTDLYLKYFPLGFY